MRVLINIRENLQGGFDAEFYPQGRDDDGQLVGESLPYTLTKKDISEQDMSGASMLLQADKDSYSAQKEQERINAESRAYLASTDWYVIRKNETGEPVPQDVLGARQTARDAVIDS